MNISSTETYLNIDNYSIRKSNILFFDHDSENVYIIMTGRRPSHHEDSNGITVPYETATATGMAPFASAAALQAYLITLVNMHLENPIVAYNMAGGDKSVVIDFPSGSKYSIQAVWADVAGVNNGTIKVLQSINGVNFDQLKTINAEGVEVDFGIAMSGAAGSANIEDKHGFTGRQMKLVFTAGTITGGTLYVYLNKVA